MKDGRDNRTFIDEDGVEWLKDESGNPLRDERGNYIPPSQSRVISKQNEFTTYDSSRGHCSFCGSISCRGNCFK